MSPLEGNRVQLRLWPGVLAVLLQWLLWLVLPLLVPSSAIVGVLGGLVGGLAVLAWWLFFSRAPQIERWTALAFMILSVLATRLLLDKSVAGAGMGILFYIYVVPAVCLGLVAGAAVGQRFAVTPRRAILAAGILLGCASWLTLRTDGVTGEGRSQFAWRWTKTSEQKLLARAGRPEEQPVAKPAVPAATPAESPAVEPASAPVTKPAVLRKAAPVAAPPSVRSSPRTLAPWPGFRGPHRDDVVTGVQIKTDWTSTPPVELWRRPVGPGWSSVAVGDGLLYTQEQRGESEIVACYDEKTGKPVWTHSDAARFYESNGGAGPRATPTLHDGQVYTFGATGILNALDAGDGHLLWTRNAATDTGAKLPGWGFSGSPLVVDDLVIVAASGRLAAYERANGNPRWRVTTGGGSYSSPHLLNIGGVPQVVLLNGGGATSVAPADGKVLWKHAWPGSTILQPAMTADGGVLITTGDMSGGLGTRRLAVARGSGGWTANEVWTSTGLKPYFNDIVVHDGHAYGFDGSILSCIDLQDGKRKWKGGRYGHGQLLLLADQNLLLVLSEEGELALVSATPNQFTEIARIPAMEGKTWNHPVLAGNILVVRNGQEMVAFRLTRASS